MKKILTSMAAVSAIAAAASPAAAQYGTYQNQYPNQQYGAQADGNFSMRIDQLRTRIQTGVQSGAITRQEAQPLRQQLRQLADLERQYSMNGISGRERADLQQRLQYLRQQLRAAEGRGSGQGYGYGQGYGQGQYDRDDDYGQSGYNDYDRDDDGYDDRYEQPAQRGGIGGLVDSLLGTGGLRVGQRVSGGLYGVPYQYQSQYRDGYGYYHRSDGRNIYRIDARSQTVIRVYPMR